MYQISKTDRQAILDMSLVGYPARDGAAEKALEDKVQKTLPIIPGLVADMIHGERVAVMGRQAEMQRAEFVALHGDAFYCEMIRPVPNAVVEISLKQYRPAVAVVEIAQPARVRQVA